MRRRSGTSGESAKTRRRKTVTLKRHNAPKTVRRSAGLSKKVAELTRELNEALERQTAASQILGAISRAKFQLQPILQSVVETAARLCRAEQAQIFRREDGVYRHAVFHGFHDPVYLEIERQSPISPGPGTLVGRVATTRQVARIDDAWTDPLYEKKEDAKIGGLHSMIGVPLLYEGEPIGVIALARTRVEPFTDREIELARTFASQAVIAIENTRLLNELRESLEQQTATAEVLSVISSSPGELEPVFETLLSNAVRICGAKFGMLFLPEGDGYRIVALHGAPPAFAESRRREPVISLNPATTLGRVAATKQVVQVEDIRVDPAYTGDPTRSPLLDLSGARTMLNVPMLKDDELVGQIAIYRQEVRPFTDKQIELVQNFAAQAVIAIENTRLLNELRRRTDDLSESLEQQTATSEVLKVISRSPGELEPVFQAMLENAVRISEAKFGTLFRFDGNAFYWAAGTGTPPKLAEFQKRRGLFQPRPGSRLESVMRTKQVSYTVDNAAEAVPEMSTVLGGARSIVVVPMLKDEVLVGVISIYRQEVRPFTEKQIELVQNFAAQAVIAIENTGC